MLIDGMQNIKLKAVTIPTKGQIQANYAEGQLEYK